MDNKLTLYVINCTGLKINTSPITKDAYEHMDNTSHIYLSPTKTISETIKLLKFFEYIPSNAKNFYIATGFNQAFYKLDQNQNTKMYTLTQKKCTNLILLAY